MRLLLAGTSTDIRSWTGLWSLALVSLACPVSASQDAIPTFSIQELSSFSRRQDLKEVLASSGLLAVRWSSEDDDNLEYQGDRHTALQGLCECHDHPHFLSTDQTLSIRLPDETTVRTSVATATIGLEHPLPLPKQLKEVCGFETVHAMDRLRDALHEVSKAFVGALDDLIHPNDKCNNQPLLRDSHGHKTYSTLSSIVESASHLEHFHVYTKDMPRAQPDSENSTHMKEAPAAWDWHTDAGLFLVFVPAWNCQENSADDASFWYKDERGRPIQARFNSEKTAIVMLGQGAQDWLDLTSKSAASTNQLRLSPTVHSVRWDERPRPFQLQSSSVYQLQRAWYGMMYLVPESAMIYGAKTLRDVRSALSWSKLSKNEVPEQDMDLTMVSALGCGISDAPMMAWNGEDIVEIATMRRRMQHQDPSTCNNVTNFFCWMQCLEIPNADQAQGYVNEGYSLYCLDPAVLASSGNQVSEAAAPCEDGYVHNANCLGSWQPTAPGVPAAVVNVTADPSALEQPFCYSGTTMYMDGFHFIQSTTCVIFLFQSWVLDSGGKYALAFLGTLLAGISLEKLIQQRRKTMASMEAGHKRLMVSGAFYGTQLTLGYVMMLIIMIYAGALFIATVLGLVCGHILFNAKDAILPLETINPKVLVQSSSAEFELSNDIQDHSTSEQCEGPNDCCACEGKEPKDVDLDSSCCGKILHAGTSAKMPPRDHLIPEGSTPCCQYSSCD